MTLAVQRTTAIAVAAALLLILLFAWFAVLQAADFYECPPNRTLVVCQPGTSPGADCTFVGSGQTTIPPRACA